MMIRPADTFNRQHAMGGGYGPLCACGCPRMFHSALKVNGPKVGPCWSVARCVKPGTACGCRGFKAAK